MKFIVSTAAIIFFSTVMCAQAPAETLPDFTFFKLDKKVFTNKDLATGKMLFFVFFDTDCDHCQHAMQYLDHHSKDFGKAAIYLVTLDDQGKIDRFMKQYGPGLKTKKNITILQDTQNQFLVKFKPRKYPSMYLYSAQKKLIHYDDNEKKVADFSSQINKSAVK